MIEDSVFTNQIAYLKIYQSEAGQVNVELKNVSFSAHDVGIGIYGDFNEMTSYINLTVRDSHFQSLSYFQPLVYVRFCSSHVTLDVRNCTFAHSKNEAIMVQTASINALVTDNVFTGIYRGSWHLGFCNPSSNRTSTALPHKIEISNNRFTSDGEAFGNFLYFNSDGIQELNHSVNISSNDFQHISNTSNAIYIQSKQYRHHSYTIASNNFTKIVGNAIGVRGACLHLSINDNRIQNSACRERCVLLNGTQGQVNITGNIFMDNSPQDSVIALVHTSGSSNFTTYVNRNKFKNNTAVVLSTNVPYVVIHENFFENDNFYNIRVTATNNSYKHDVINASFNDWGTSDVTAIARSIYDNVYDEKLPKVIFHPYLESKDTTQ